MVLSGFGQQKTKPISGKGKSEKVKGKINPEFLCSFARTPNALVFI